MQVKEKRMKIFKYVMTALVVAALIAAIIFMIYCYRQGAFESQESMRAFLAQYGIWMPVVFLLFQVMQVIIMFIPGPIACAVGVLLYGPVIGTIFNYIGISIGSACAFWLSRKYGKQFILLFVKEEKYDKYNSWLRQNNRYGKLFALGTLIPVAPDDLLCYLVGLTDMPFKKMIKITMIYKIPTIIIYTVCTYLGAAIFLYS